MECTRGGGGEGNLGAILVRMCGLTSQNPPDSCTLVLKIGTHSCTYRSKLPSMHILAWGTEYIGKK